MNKFGKLKNIYALKRQADAMKKKMAKITVEVHEGLYSIVMRGDQTVVKVEEDGEENEALKKLFNKAVKESQKAVAKKMRGELSDFGLPGT